MSALENHRVKIKTEMVLVTLGTSSTAMLFPLNIWNRSDYSQLNFIG